MSDAHRETPLDVFVYEPFDFAAEEALAIRSTHLGDVPARFLDIPALIAMKQAAGRDQDRIDIEKLKIFAELRAHDAGA